MPGMGQPFHYTEVKMRFEFNNEPFIPAIAAVALPGTAIAASWNKVKDKVVTAYAHSQGIEVEHLRLIDLCGSNGRLHPRLRAFIEKLPRGEKQSGERYLKYKQEICAHLQRAVDATIAHLRSPGGDPENTVNEETAYNEHPVLAEIYKTLPREIIFIPRKAVVRTETVTENGRLFYLACVEALKTCDASTVQEFLSLTGLITKSIERVCPTEKISAMNTVLQRTRKQLGITISKPPPRLRADAWPSPLREEFRQLAAVVDRQVSGELRAAAATAGVKLQNKLSSVTVNSLETRIGKLLAENWSEGPLSVRDIMRTRSWVEVDTNGNQDIVYHNSFLSPLRERERARQSKRKGVGFDSDTFKNTVSNLKTLAAYNGIFEYHQIISKAFKPHIDLDNREDRKAEKKMLIDRHEMDAWINRNRSEYERILKGKTFVRDKSKRSYREADKNMRFVLFYVKLVTMKDMGFRQRQLRDCRYGVNLRIADDSFTFSYTKDQTKNRKPLNFTANMRTSAITHNRLYQTLSLYHRYAYPYVQSHLAPRRTDDAADPSGQFYVYLDVQGRFRCFHPLNNRGFSANFRNACRCYLPGPELSKQAILLLHPHYLRGASMDTFMLDHGGSSESASKYFGDTVTVMERAYRDRHAMQDASRDVILVNLGLKQLSALEAESGNGSREESKNKERSSKREMSALHEASKLRAALDAANERIAHLESKLAS
jgi:hypothetical protein